MECTNAFVQRRVIFSFYLLRKCRGIYARTGVIKQMKDNLTELIKDLERQEPEKERSRVEGRYGKVKSETEGEYFSHKGEAAHSCFRVKDTTHSEMRFGILCIFSCCCENSF